MPTIKETKDKITDLSIKALAVAENHGKLYDTPADQKKALEPLELDIKKWQDELADLEYVDTARKAFSQNGDPIEKAGDDKGKGGGGSAGKQFADSAQYKSFKEAGGAKSGSWNTGEIEVKSPLTEGTTAVPGGGYSLPFAQPELLPGILPIQFRPLTVADLFPSSGTSSPLIRYLVETVATNGAAPTAESGLLPESSLSFTSVDETLRKIGTFLPVSDEMLEDYEQIQGYIDARLGLFVKLAEEYQLLSGDGTGSNLLGLLNRTGLAATVTKGSGISPAGDNNMDAIYRQITVVRTTQFLEPDAIAIDPLGWQNTLLAKTSQGVYYANGPFADVQQPRLWGKPVAVSPALASTTALVGPFQTGAQIFRKRGLTLEASNSHADYFQRDLTAIRATERAGLAVYRPGAFGLVAGLN